MTSFEIRRATDVEDAKRIFAEDGLVVIENVLVGAALERARDAVRRGVESDRQLGMQLQGFAFDPDEKNTRLFDLIPKDAVFRELAEHPIAIEMASHFIGDRFLLSNFSGNITAPGSGAMGMHADAGYMPVPWPRYHMAINVAWALDDFTDDVGATRIVPGSYHLEYGPDFDESGRANPVIRNTVPVECKAGSIFIMDGKVWHQTGPNTSQGKTRTGLFAYYVRSFIRPQFDWSKTVGADILKQCSPLMREMLGFGGNDSSKSADYPQLRKLKELEEA